MRFFLSSDDLYLYVQIVKYSNQKCLGISLSRLFQLRWSSGLSKPFQAEGCRFKTGHAPLEFFEIYVRNNTLNLPGALQ